MSEFNIRFRGVRGSYPIANCNFLRYGGNTSCVEVNVGGHLIILDAGTGMIGLGNDLMEKHIISNMDPDKRTPIHATVLLSHIHQDHIQGFTFFHPLHLESTELAVFGNDTDEDDLSKSLSGILFGKTFPLDLGDIAGKLEIKNISSGDRIILHKGSKPIISTDKSSDEDVIITALKSYAHPQDGVMVYKITYKDKSLVYATDKESYLGGDKKLIDFARGCNLLIHDAQYTTEDYLNRFTPKQGYGHSTFDMAIEIQKQTKADKLVFFHYDPNYDDEKLDKIEKHYKGQASEKFIMSREGLEINLM